MKLPAPVATVGDGPSKVLLLTGLFGADRAFDAMLAHADRERFEYAVLSYRGYGAARDVAGDYSLREVVSDALALLDTLGWRAAHLAGHSLGALVAQLIALAAPHRVRSIVSMAGMNARGASRDPARRQLLDDAAHDLGKRAALIAAGVGHRYGAGFARRIAESGWQAIAPIACASYARDASQTDIHVAVEGSTVPLLALVGAHDPGCTETLTRDTTLRWYPNAVLDVLADAGHYPMDEAPPRTLAALESFVSAAGA